MAMFVGQFTPVTGHPDEDWATTELQGLTLNDARLEARTRTAVQTLFAQAGRSIPAACPTPAEMKALYRLFANPKVTRTALLTPHQHQVRARLQAVSVALLLSDITELNYTDKTVADDLGYIGDNKTRGLFLHPLLAVTPDRLPLGLAEVYTWTRTDISAKAKTRKHAPLAEKETFCWLRQYRQACALAAHTPTTTLVYVADRGGDIYELYHDAATHAREGTPRAELLIRCSEPQRCLCPTDATGAGQAAHLQDQAATLPVVGTLAFDLPATAERPGRHVAQTVRAGTVWLRAPYRQDKSVQDAPIQVVLLQEDTPPPGTPPLVWLLCTTLPVATAADTETVVQYYLARWEIECYFKVLKSGCAVEKLYLQTWDRLEPCLICYLLIAWRLLYCTRVGRACPDVPCTAVYTAAEWQAVYLITTGAATLPPTPPTLRELTHLIARGGGFVGRAGDGEPGIQTMWIGLQRMADYACAYDTFGPGRRKPP